jgi:steroid 5-alpha reductase family enzyme
MIKYNLWNVNSFILLGIIGFWSLRLTINWLITYKGVGHEDWRYAMYRQKYPPFIFQVISFVGLHFVPTIVVYAGMVCVLFTIEVAVFSYLSIIGIVVSVLATILEIVSDDAVHRFLKDHAGEKRCCNYSVWKYSRHPNYLGELLFWIGLFLYFLFARMSTWYFGLGFLTIVILFLSISIPMMEKHNKERRVDYEEYKATTSVLFLLPRRKQKDNK